MGLDWVAVLGLAEQLLALRCVGEVPAILAGVLCKNGLVFRV